MTAFLPVPVSGGKKYGRKVRGREEVRGVPGWVEIGGTETDGMACVELRYDGDVLDDVLLQAPCPMAAQKDTRGSVLRPHQRILRDWVKSCTSYGSRSAGSHT